MYTDRHGDHWIDEYSDILYDDLTGYTPATREHVIAAKPADYADAIAIAHAYLAPLDALTYVGGGADYANRAWLVAGTLDADHVVIDTGEYGEGWEVVARMSDAAEYSRCIGGYASPAQAIAAAREFAASVGLV
jgi:hypothetical protein